MNIHTDAWGKLMEHIEHTGCIDQPYRFVGELGYYTHWQDAHLTLLQLGVRFYDPQVGRFGQRDALARPEVSQYCYAADHPSREGTYDITVPDFVKDASCDKIGYGGYINWAIQVAKRYAKRILMELSLYLCPDKIVVKCKKDCKSRVCGMLESPTRIMINLGPQCSSAKCLILHEMIHACIKPGHLWKGTVWIPGCGSNTDFKEG